MRLPPNNPTTDAEWQAVMRVFSAYMAERPQTDAEWQQAMRTLGVEGRVGARRPTNDVEWQTYFVRPLSDS